jgi:dihydroorotase-like cyclic amidohydrolase
MGTLIKGGKVVSAAATTLADVLIEGETIARLRRGSMRRGTP